MATQLKNPEQLQKENIELNIREYAERRIALSSTPQRVFLQINAPCNVDCVFCSKGYDYPAFRLGEYLGGFGGKLAPVIERARELILSGSGELLALPDAEGILRHFNTRFPHVDKFIATNASHDRPRIWELIADSSSRYTLQLSLHASDEESHRAMTRSAFYDRVMKNVRGLCERRKVRGTLTLHLMFIMTTLNAEKLPDFIRLGADLGVDKITAGYFYVYEAQQKYLSLYFKKELANRVIDEARALADKLGVEVQLPPKFGASKRGLNPAGKTDCCSEPWHQIMVNADGRILPCDVYGDFSDNLNDKNFADIWNGPAYRKIRESLKEGRGCIETCPRRNAAALDKWESHVIRRRKGDGQIVKEYHEALRKP